MMALEISTPDLPDLIKPGMVVYVGGSTGEPKGLVKLLQECGGSFADVGFIQQPIGAVNTTDLSAIGVHGRQQTFFMTPALSEGLGAGRVKFTPMHMRSIFDYLNHAKIDVALLLAAKDQQGVLRYGPCVDYLDAVLRQAAHVVVEVSDQFVAPAGAPPVADSAHYIYYSDETRPLFPVVTIDETSRTIGHHIAALINDGDCLQTGIGAVPAAILASLGDRNDLGFHGGLIDDGVASLIRAGNINGAHKSLDKGKHITGMALGSADLLDWLSGEPDVIFRSADYTHEASVIRELQQFVSVNSAVEVDLFGQVNAEVAGGRQISGTGGAVDFMRAAKMSQGGRSIVAMSATARRGSVSRIVPKAEMVTALRTDVDIVVTEFGVAAIKDSAYDERAEALISISHPDFRDQLRDSWRAMRGF